MKSRLVILLLLLLLLSWAFGVEVDEKGARPGVWTSDLDAAKELAKTKTLPMFVQFTGSDWCVWCKLMDRNVFATEDWKSYGKKMVLVFIDFPKDKNLISAELAARNRELAKAFAVRGYPTYVVMEPDGTTVLAKLGAGESKTGQTFPDEVEEVLTHSEAAMKALAKRMGKDIGDGYLRAVETLLTERRERMPEKNVVSPAWAEVRNIETAFFSVALTGDDRAIYRTLLEQRQSSEREKADFAASVRTWDGEKRKTMATMTAHILNLNGKILALESKARGR